MKYYIYTHVYLVSSSLTMFNLDNLVSKLRQASSVLKRHTHTHKAPQTTQNPGESKCHLKTQ